MDEGGRPRGAHNEEFWRKFLTEGGDPMKDVLRLVFRHLPAEPRCRMCAAPFAGAGAPIMRMIGKRQSAGSPTICTSCFTFMEKYRGGAEIEGSMLFADIRGSTALAETMSSAEYHALLDRYYTTATKVVFDHDGYLDKFVGDELVATFFPLLSGDRHAARAVEAAQALLRAVGHADSDGPWVQIGAGVHTGLAWFGVVGEAGHAQMTAVGDAVNVAARLASAAGPGEVLVSDVAAVAADLDPALERRPLDLKGKSAETDVVTLRVSASEAPTG